MDWQRYAGQHCEAVREHLVQQPRDLGQVQAEEIRVKMQGGIVWLAMAPDSDPVRASANAAPHRTIMTRFNNDVRCEDFLVPTGGFEPP